MMWHDNSRMSETYTESQHGNLIAAGQLKLGLKGQGGSHRVGYDVVNHSYME